MILLTIGFLATAGGSIWVILTPLGEGINFGAAFVYQGGMVVGVVGLVALAYVALRRRSSASAKQPKAPKE